MYNYNNRVLCFIFFRLFFTKILVLTKSIVIICNSHLRVYQLENIGIGLAVQTGTRSFTCSLSVLYMSDFVSLNIVEIAWYVLGLIFRVWLEKALIRCVEMITV